MKTKNIIIINTYANSTEKSALLKEYIQQIQKVGNDILLITHLPVSNDIIDLVNYYIYDSENAMLPVERSPSCWWANDVEYISIYSCRHAYAIIKNIYTALSFTKSLGYENFIFSEYDNILSDIGVNKMHDLYKYIENTSKKIFVFKIEKTLYNQFGYLYETKFFAGNINFFLKNVTLVKSLDEWYSTEPYASTSELLENIFIHLLSNVMEHVYEECKSLNEYFSSIFDVHHIFDYKYSIVYNLENEFEPLFFLISKGGHYELKINNDIVISRHYEPSEHIRYKFNIEHRECKVECKYNNDIILCETINYETIQQHKIYAIRGLVK